MHDNTLVAIALTTSALGIAGLLFCLIVLDAPGASIPQAKDADDGTMLRITGTVERVQQRAGMTILTISQPATIEIIVDGNATGDLARDDCVIVQGKKGTYKENSQISASRISRCGAKR